MRSARRFERLGWLMRLTTFTCVLVQSTFTLLDASWDRTTWPYLTAGAAVAVLVDLWAGRQAGKERARSTQHRPLTGE